MPLQGVLLEDVCIFSTWQLSFLAPKNLGYYPPSFLKDIVFHLCLCLYVNLDWIYVHHGHARAQGGQKAAPSLPLPLQSSSHHTSFPFLLISCSLSTSSLLNQVSSLLPCLSMHFPITSRLLFTFWAQPQYFILHRPLQPLGLTGYGCFSAMPCLHDSSGSCILCSPKT